MVKYRLPQAEPNVSQQVKAFVGIVRKSQPFRRSVKQGTKVSTAFGAYTVHAPVGQGGAGTVYRVTDDAGVVFALKCLDKSNAARQTLKRFKNEILFGQTIRHPNLLAITDYGVTSNGAPFYVMPFFDASLRSLISTGIGKDQAGALFSQLLDGLEAAHQYGVIHRDLKPENILYDGANNRLVIADFGIARFSEEHLFTIVDTSTDQRLGNFQYSAPEQRRKGASVSQPADIYALGLILNEMFTGEVPHGTSFRLISAVASEHAHLDAIVDQMIRQRPDDRPTISDIRKNLNAADPHFAQPVVTASSHSVPRGISTTANRLLPTRHILLSSRRGVAARWALLGVNDLLPNYESVAEQLARARLEVGYRFSERGVRPPPPHYPVIVAKADVGMTMLRQVCEAVAPTGEWYLQIWDRDISERTVAIGAYGYGGAPAAQLNSTLLTELRRSSFTASKLRAWIANNGVVLDADYPRKDE